jgi:CubicO group peptidase (beta-lactamase class C family)
MAKLGYLYLKGGVWQDERIVSEVWVRESLKRRANAPWGDGYSYQWWIKDYNLGAKSFETFAAYGWGGQRIIVFPELDMVVVFTEAIT